MGTVLIDSFGTKMSQLEPSPLTLDRERKYIARDGKVCYRLFIPRFYPEKDKK